MHHNSAVLFEGGGVVEGGDGEESDNMPFLPASLQNAAWL